MSGDRVRRGRGPDRSGPAGRIASAASRCVAEQGIEGLTHRKVAAEAGVPRVRPRITSRRWTTWSPPPCAGGLTQRRRPARVGAIAGPDADLAVALADFVIRSIGEKRTDTVAEYNLYVLALHRPQLRSAAVAWDDALAEVLRSHG